MQDEQTPQEPESVFFETVTERIGDRVLASTIRPATESDIQAAMELLAQGNCPHNVVVDRPGWLYDTRSCHTCGRGLGTV